MVAILQQLFFVLTPHHMFRIVGVSEDNANRIVAYDGGKVSSL
jgi:hypothetical protein